MNIKQKIIIYIAIVILIIGAVVYAVILPTIQDIQEINGAVLAERVDLEKKYLKGQLLKKTAENFEKIKPHQDKLLKIYINKNEELAYITRLENLANENNITQSIELPSPTTPKTEAYEPLALNINASGSFNDLMQYLKAIEQMEVYFNVSKLVIKTEGKNQSTSRTITIQMTGQAFKLLKADSVK